MFPVMYFTVTWMEADKIRLQLKDLDVSYRVDAYQGEVAFLFCDVPARVYGQIRKVFGTDAKRFI